MKKVAVFVEGQTEQIFIKEMLLCMADYSNKIGIRCHALRKGEMREALYSYPCEKPEEADVYYAIYDAGNDRSVLQAIKKHLAFLNNAGFTKIIGLRDMFSDEYRKLSKDEINPAINQRFINGAMAQIEGMPHSGKISFHFAIMETEAWFLGIKGLFAQIDGTLSPSYIKEQLGIDLENNDPETTIYHPAKEVGRILGLISREYDKKAGEVSAIVSHISKDDYSALAQSPFCASFTTFFEELMK